MKSTGMTRRVDKMGRVVIPKEISAQLNIKNNVDRFEISIHNDKVILQKYHPTCIFCDSIMDVVEFSDYIVCKNCIEKLNELKETAK